MEGSTERPERTGKGDLSGLEWRAGFPASRLHFADEVIKAQRGYMTCQRSPSLTVTEQASKHNPKTILFLPTILSRFVLHCVGVLWCFLLLSTPHPKTPSSSQEREALETPACSQEDRAELPRAEDSHKVHLHGLLTPVCVDQA